MVFNLEYITSYIDKNFLDKSKQRLINLGYKIYEEGETYQINGKTYLIERNVYYVAIK